MSPSLATPPSWISGILNCHCIGLNSYVISNRVSDAEGMVRVFHNEGLGVSNSNFMGSLIRDEHFAIAPHNHRQAIRLIPIRGTVLNVSFDLDRQSHDHRTTEWVFKSAILTGKASIDYRDSIDMHVRDVALLPPQGISLAASDVHTVIASPGAAWLVIEGTPAPASQQNLFYSRRPDYVLQTEGMYEPMKWWHLRKPKRLVLFDEAMKVLNNLRAEKNEEMNAITK